MPTYDYKCKKCGNAFEVFHSMSSDPVKFCPKCGGEVKKLIGTGAGTIFKGTGFYHTDYKNKASKTAKTETKESVPAKSETKIKPPTKSE
jgi:putative FmdB family regulatory protein